MILWHCRLFYQTVPRRLAKLVDNVITSYSIHYTKLYDLTIDLIPEFKVVVYREGESPENYMVEAEVIADMVDEDLGYEEAVEEILA